MKHTVLPSLLTLIVGSAFGYSARTPAPDNIGSYYSYTADVTYDLALDVDSSGNPRTQESLAERRLVRVVPSFYGDAFAVTQNDSGQSIVWYKSGDGSVRNVTALNGLIKLERRGADRVQVEARR